MDSPKFTPQKNSVKIISFSNQTTKDKKLLKKFVDFHWRHYENEKRYIPLLDYEYLGFKLIGMTGFFEPQNKFMQYADMRFFLAQQNGEVVGRCNVFVNPRHNAHWNDKVGFFGQFESIEDPAVTTALIDAASEWLKSRNMDTIRGPQNLPVNEATPGLLTDGFDTRPVIYYHYNKPYYQQLLETSGLEPVKRVLSWEVPVDVEVGDKLEKIALNLQKKFNVKVETWGERPLDVRKKEMLEIYNEAWSENFGFVPFEKSEFESIIDDMQLIIDKGLFIFIYIDDHPAGFFGGVPNATERMEPFGFCRRCELLRAAKMLLTKNRVKGFRLGYMGVKKEFRNLGLSALMLWHQQKYAEQKGYEYCDAGWVLEDNYNVIKLIDLIGANSSKTYTIFEKKI
ncbi:GNAT family N-acetyltransferase [candidate division KSB1 bacterium]|nr:GNAT family N-acetyltransferase [candidate division KSB1 bacterium]